MRSTNKETATKLFVGLLLSLTALGCAASGRTDGKRDERPNILLIVADDLGYADLGCYGGDIATPNIDALAAEGILFTQFHTAPYCAPSRAMLLSGNNNHVAGMARQGRHGILTHPYPGYENHLSDRVVPLPRLLRTAGYHTSMAGKWHLGLEREHTPTAAGFERSMVLLDGAGNHWNQTGFFEGGSTYWEDGPKLYAGLLLETYGQRGRLGTMAYTDYPEGRYSTELYTSKLIGYIDDARRDGRPFFAYAAYTSPHWPLQVPDEELDLYAGRYDQGYDRLREQRFESLKAAGIIPRDSALPPRNDAITPWEDLDAEERRRESRKMELYAAMVHNLDGHVGRLVDYLERHGLRDNTLIVFMADNGAAAEDFYNDERFMEYLRAHYDNCDDNMGRPDSFISYGPQWAEAGSAPFARHKGYTREGGITAPMIMTGPGVARSRVIDRGYVTVMDLAPTFLEYAGAAYPDGEETPPMLGTSMTTFLAGSAAAVHDDEYVTTMSHDGRALVRRGRWKLTNLDRPFDEDEMELFDLLADPGETNDLAEAEPEKYEEMLELWRAERKRLGIVLPQDL